MHLSMSSYHDNPLLSSNYQYISAFYAQLLSSTNYVVKAPWLNGRKTDHLWGQVDDCEKKKNIPWGNIIIYSNYKVGTLIRFASQDNNICHIYFHETKFDIIAFKLKH